MALHFLVPSIHNRPTGGNIYNRRIITELQARGRAELVPWSPEPPFPSPVAGSAPSAIIVDSLLVRHENAIRRLGQSHPSVPLILLAHYLHCIDPHRSGTARAAAERSILPVFDGAVTTSRYTKNALSSEGIAASDIRVVPPGLDEPFRAEVRTPPPQDPPHLLTVANVLPGKGLLSLVDTLDALSDESWQWTLIGDDSLDSDFAERLYTRLTEVRLTDRMTGPKTLSPDALRSTYDRAEIFVLPSRFETCGMAMREAMARALPVVGYRVGGLPENLGDGDGGCLVPPDDPHSFEEALRTLLRDPTVRDDIGTAARARSHSFPAWHESATRFRSFVESVASTGRGA